jgi:hypothetical protein
MLRHVDSDYGRSSSPDPEGIPLSCRSIKVNPSHAFGVAQIGPSQEHPLLLPAKVMDEWRDGATHRWDSESLPGVRPLSARYVNLIQQLTFSLNMAEAAGIRRSSNV